MLQIRDLVWGLLFVGCTGKKLSCFLFIFGCVQMVSGVVAKAKCVEMKAELCWLWSSILPLLSPAASLPLTPDSAAGLELVPCGSGQNFLEEVRALPLCRAGNASDST